MNLLIVGGGLCSGLPTTNGGRASCVEHWSGRKHRDLVRTIPKATEAVVVVLDRVSHALAKRVRGEASRRGLPVYFLKRSRQIDADSRPDSACFDPQCYGRHSIDE
ncbi:MAG: dihydroorotate dehydrogenase [Nitrospira sp.]|nr:MAG: dihydroorotate dehydrogenase [Nitrospira sp.]